MATIVLFDAYPISRRGFLDILQRAGKKLDGLTVASVDELAIIGVTRAIDLLILTVNTPKDGNLALLLAQCKAICPETPIAFYDEQYGASHLDKWLKLGISGYLLKSEPSTVLLQCVDVLLGNGKYLSPEAWTRFVGPLQKPMPLRRQKLARKEFEIARHLSTGKSTTWIANELGNKPSTISTVKKRIFHKLKVDNVVDLCRVIGNVTDPSGRTLPVTSAPSAQTG